MSRRGRFLSHLALVALLATACGHDRMPPPTAAELGRLPWDSVVARARGTTVTWRMWRGDPSVNRFVDGWVAPRLKARYGITLHAVEGQGPELVNQLAVERQSGARGSVDLVWLNGETFSQLRRAGLLWGPWAGRLPAAAYVDSASPIVRRDFEQDPAGFESPWGRVEYALIYDSARTPAPPRTVAELHEWIRAHPGRFTHDQGFTGTGFLTILMYALNGGVAPFQGGFDAARYAAASARVWRWLDAVRPALWREGRTFPPDVAALHRLFANGEVDFSMSYNQNEVVTKARQGVLPATARPLLLRDGMLANTHFVGIPASAPNPAGAMLVADFLLSPDAQYEKARPAVWADGTVLALERLPAEWAARFRALARDPRTLPADSLARYAVPEVAPAWREHLAADWRAQIR
ncbi:MAG TPA: ABC transporter substrate-binding protein [Gemmatimonadales bacterium]|nr:ABC transporter substrate-binding protein [Gemmatimonadales bacterium]